MNRKCRKVSCGVIIPMPLKLSLIRRAHVLAALAGVLPGFSRYSTTRRNARKFMTSRYRYGKCMNIASGSSSPTVPNGNDDTFVGLLKYTLYDTVAVAIYVRCFRRTVLKSVALVLMPRRQQESKPLFLGFSFRKHGDREGRFACLPIHVFKWIFLISCGIRCGILYKKKSVYYS